MVFPLGISVAKGISTAPFWSGGTASLLVRSWDFVRHLVDYPMGVSPRLSKQSITGLKRSRLGGALVFDFPYADGLGHWSTGNRRRSGFNVQHSAGLCVVDFGLRRGSHCCSILAIRRSLVRAYRGGTVAGGVARVGGCFLSARRHDLGSAGGDCRCGLIFHEVAA